MTASPTAAVEAVPPRSGVSTFFSTSSSSAYGSGVFSCPLNVGIPQAEPKSTRQFQLRWSCLSQMNVVRSISVKKENEKAVSEKDTI